MDYIEIRGAKTPIAFNILAIRSFCKYKGLKKPSEMDAVFKAMGDFTDLSFDQIDDVAQLIIFGLKEGSRQEAKEYTHSFDDILADLFSNPEKITQAMTAFSNQSQTDATPGEQQTQVAQ